MADCPNCGRWSFRWCPGEMCPECTNPYERSIRHPSKVLVGISADVANEAKEDSEHYNRRADG